MKKICSLFLLLTVMLCLPLTLRAEQLNEGFEDATFAPDGWKSIHVSGEKSWTRSTTYHNGAASAYVSWASSGHENYLVTPKLQPVDGESLSFYVASQSYSGTTLTIEVSTTTAEAASFTTTLATYTTGSSGTIGTTSTSSWVEKVIDLSTYAGQEIYVAFHVVDDNGSSLYLDDVTGVSIKEDACPRPKNLALDGDADATEALIVWGAVAGAEAEGGYELEYSTSEDFTNPQAPSVIEGEAGLLEDLTPATTYYVRVRAFCGEEGYSEWSSTFSFKTKCVAVSAFPWSENFDDITAGSGVLPDCWNRINNSSSYGAYPYVYEYSSYAHSGTNSLYFATGGSSSYDDEYAILPEMSDLDGKRIVFWAKGYNSTSTIKVGRMSNPADASTFVQIGEDIALTSSYQKYAVNMEESGDYIAIMVANLSSYSSNGAYIDDIVVEEIPSCLEPSGLAFVSSETNSAILNWEASESGESEWDIYYSTENVAPTAETVPSIEKTSAKAIQSGLTPATTYYVWVRAHCNDDDRSAWIGGISFETKCEAVSALDEDFDDITAGSGVLPKCWKRISNGSYSTSYPYVTANTSYSTYSHSAANSLQFYVYGSSSYDDEYAILPEMSTISGKRISFYAKRYSTYTCSIKVGVMTDPEDASTFTQIGDDIALTANHEKYTVNLSGTGNYIAFKVAKISSTTNGAYIDDIVVEDVPSCLEPSGLAFASATTTSATFTWTAGGTETAWDIYYSTENVAPTAETAPIIEETSDKEIPNGLNPSSTYYVWVRAHCGDTDQSPWIGGISFQTECDAVSALNENFNGYTGSTSTSVPAGYPDDQLPTCWQFLNRAASSSNYPQAFISSASGYVVSGNCLFFKSSSTTPLYAILPELAGNISALQLTFTYRNEGTGSSNGTLYVGYLTDPADASTFVSVDTCEQTTTLTEQEVLFADAPAGSYIAFKYQGGTSNNYYLSIDDVVVGPIPTCQKPADPKCDAKTAHTATLSWTNGAEGQNAWQIVVDTIAAFNPDTVNAARIIDVASNPAIIDGLLSSKTYYAYVRANCGEDGFSAWSKKKVTFTTIAGNIAPSGLAVDGASLASDAATVTWVSAKNDLHASFDLFYSKINELPETPEGDSLFINITDTFKVLSGLDAETTYYVWVRDNCGADGNSAWVSFSFTTLANCPVPAELSASEIAAHSAKIAWNVGTNDSYNVRYRTAALDNVLLEQGFEDGMGSWTKSNAHSSTEISSSAAHTGAKGFSFYFTSNPPQYLISPEIAGIDADATLEFYYKNGSATWAETFQVGYSTTTNAISAFTFGDEITASDNEWHKYSGIVPAGTKYITIKCTSDDQFYLYIDDIVLFGAPTPAGDWTVKEGSAEKFLAIDGLEPDTKYEAQVQGVCGTNPTEWSEESVFFTTIPSCMAPSALEVNDITTNSAILSWTNGAEGQNAWQICLNGDEENLIDATENPYTLALAPATVYSVKVRANCGLEDKSAWSDAIEFVTECEAVSAASGWSEDFNGYTAGATSSSAPSNYPNDQLPTCWQFLNRSSSSSHPQAFLSSYYSYAVSGNCLFFTSSSATPLYAILPEFVENISALQLTFTYRNEGTSDSNGTLYVGYLTDPADASTFASVLTCERTNALTEKEVLFTDAPAGSRIAFKYEGGTSNNYYLSIDDVFVGAIPTCQKPADPKCDAKTAHTATLSWTNGEEGQNAWQIVVDTIADFNPDTVNEARIIDVTSNPAVIDLPKQSKTYYAYVRANCGGSDVSYWSKKKVTFTTIAGNIAPSGLAVDNASLASDAATVTWVAAENDLHENFELFYSKINELPETPEGDSLISNIAEAEYAFASLEAETTYYVWVRDNCGIDGYSAWVSISFTTLANCPVPAELSASEVAAHSAKIAWNVGANDNYNVRYRTAALENALLEQGFEDGIGGWTMSNTHSSTGINSSAAHTGSNGFRFSYTTLPPQYLISPEIAGIDADATLEFYYKNYSSSYAESFEVGFSSTDNATSSFAFEAEVTADDQQWHQYSVTVPAGTKYISIKCTSDNAYYLYIDDIVLLGAATPAGEWQEGGNSLVKELTIEGLTAETKYEAQVQGVCGVDPTEWSESVFFTTTPSCIKPASLDAEVLSANSVKLDWTAGGEETFFQVVCVLSGEEPNWEGVEPIEALTITIDTLNLDNDYDFYVRAYCGESDHSDFRMVSAHVGYCVPAPTSIDGSGIIAIAFNEEDAYTDIHPTAAPFYADNKAIEFVAHADEIDSILITYSTGYTYGTIIWVDWNKNLAFEASEVVFSGESSESKPTTLSCVFTIPAETELGAYRLRIGGADSFFNGYINGTSSADPDPCGTGTYTIYEDYTLLIVEKPHDPTGLSGAGIENVAIKRIENDQVVIIRNGEKFTIMGVKIQ